MANALYSNRNADLRAMVCSDYDYGLDHGAWLRIGNWELSYCKRFVTYLEPESFLSAAIFLKTYRLMWNVAPFVVASAFFHLFAQSDRAIRSFHDVITQSRVVEKYTPLFNAEIEVIRIDEFLQKSKTLLSDTLERLRETEIEVETLRMQISSSQQTYQEKEMKRAQIFQELGVKFEKDLSLEI